MDDSQTRLLFKIPWLSLNRNNNYFPPSYLITCLLFPSHDWVAYSVRFLNQDIAFNTVVLGSLMTCAFMASSLRLSACFIYDKRAWVTYCSLSWQWYIFETSNIADKIYFIIFSGRKWETMLECSAHNKTSLVTSVYNMFLLLFTSAGSHTYGHECAIYTVQC